MTNQEPSKMSWLPDESWVPILREWYWHGKLKVWLSKGYVTLQLTEKERKRWRLSEIEIGRIEEILQVKIDKEKAESIKSTVLQLLNKRGTIKVPNAQIGNKSRLYTDIIQITPEITEKIAEEVQPFLIFLDNHNYDTFKGVFQNWDSQSVWPALKKGAELLAQKARENNVQIEQQNFNQFQELPRELQPFLLLVGHYYDPPPNLDKIALYRQLLLLEQQEIIEVIDFIIFVSWRQYPERMYHLTESWITSMEAILVSWLIHGVEVPGRKECRKALRFIKPALKIVDEDVEWLISHVLAQIIGASPYESLKRLEGWLIDDFKTQAQKRIEQALIEVINDKIKDGNTVDEDFPDLKTTIPAIMKQWVETGTEIQYQIAIRILDAMA